MRNSTAGNLTLVPTFLTSWRPQFTPMTSFSSSSRPTTAANPITAKVASVTKGTS